MDNILKKFFGKHKPNNIFTYEEFMLRSEEKIEKTKLEDLSEQEKIYFEYSKINLHRTGRIQKTFKPDSNLTEIINKISEPQTWLAVTEDWCGDSAQNLPYIYNYIKGNGFIKFIIILRDSNLEAIDSYFNVGNPRSIPKIVGFDKGENQLFIWGPRPKFAQDLVSQLKAEGYSKEELNNKLHLWYAKNRGKELEKELISILSNISK